MANFANQTIARMDYMVGHRLVGDDCWCGIMHGMPEDTTLKDIFNQDVEITMDEWLKRPENSSTNGSANRFIVGAI